MISPATYPGRYSTVLLWCILWGSGTAQSQGNEPGDALHALRHNKVLRFSDNYMPKDLLNGKTLVLIKLEPEPSGGVESAWKTLSEEAHPFFRVLGIDPVLYLYYPDVFAGPDFTRAIATEMTTRELSCVALLSRRQSAGIPVYGLSLTNFSGNEQIIRQGEEAWHYESPTLESLFRNLARAIGQHDLIKSNMLIMEAPEFYRSNALIRGRRNEGFISDLRIDRLAVPRFSEVAISDNPAQNGEAALVASQLNEWNSVAEQYNNELEALFADYTWPFALVEYDFNENNLRVKGFQYVLVQLRAEPEYLRRLLGYRDTSSETANRSAYLDASGQLQFTELPSGRPVYKYYIKHIHTGDVYLGEQWDAAETWQEALRRHLSLLGKKLQERR